MSVALKVLYVSDSLGTPIHPRGIFNYSISLVEMLNAMGAKVALATERYPGYGLVATFSKSFQGVAAAAIDSARAGEVYRYFLNENFTFQWRYQLPWFRFLAERMPLLAKLIQRTEELATKHHRQEVIGNHNHLFEYIPKKVAHLSIFDSFVCLDRFYYSSILRASNGLDPIEIDAKGFDAAIIDTPTYVRLAGISSSRIFAVVHDLIPLADPDIEAEARRLFAKKLEGIFALDPHMIFVSEATQTAFRNCFPRFTPRSESVVYPTIRQELTAASGRRTGRGAGLVAAVRALPRAANPGAGKSAAPPPAAPPPAAPWDASLPYFATVLSDELRKNIALVVAAFAQLAGTANMAIMGQIDADKYVDPASSPPGNIRFMGYLSEADKADVIQGSAGVIFPSLSEGFGIPIVEGAVLGVPVLCSDIPVFREVAGPSALYFDPMDANALVAAVTRALAEPEAQRARAAALQEAVLQRFSQAAMSKRVAATLEKAGLRVDAAGAS